jgi:hypothetical protein
LEQLAQLKEELKKQLSAVEEKQKAVEEGLRPQTVEQIDELERKMQDALKELQQRREELKQKEDKGPKKP